MKRVGIYIAKFVSRQINVLTGTALDHRGVGCPSKVVIIIRPRRNYPSFAEPQRNVRIGVTTIRHDVEAEVVEAVDGAGEGRRVVEVTADVRSDAVKLNFEAKIFVFSLLLGVSCERHL